MDLVRELPYWPAAMALLIEAGQMTASDYVPTYPNLSLAFEGASTDAVKAIMERNSATAVTSPKRGALDRKAKLLPNPSIDEWLLGAVVSSGAPITNHFQRLIDRSGTFGHTLLSLVGGKTASRSLLSFPSVSFGGASR